MPRYKPLKDGDIVALDDEYYREESPRKWIKIMEGDPLIGTIYNYLMVPFRRPY